MKSRQVLARQNLKSAQFGITRYDDRMRSNRRLTRCVVATGLSVLTAAVFCFSTVVRAQTTKLDQFVGQDLMKQQPQRNELKYLNDLVGKVPDLIAPAPWRVWRTHRNGRLRYIVLVGEMASMSPGGPSACIQLFDSSTKRVGAWSFLAGWRAAIDQTSLIYSSGLGQDLIVLHVVSFSGPGAVNEYFATGDDRLRLVRLENENHELMANNYFRSEFGIIPQAKTVDDWVGLLESEDKADVLSALVFLGGIHFAGKTSGKYAPLVQEFYDNSHVREVIRHLTKSENEWVRQASVLAAGEPRERVSN